MKTRNSKHGKTASRREEIIRAALACFTEHGFTQTGMADIRRRSNASTGSIYHHFKSKEQLAAAVYLEGIRDYQQGFLHDLEEQETARDGIFAVVRFHLKWVEDHADWTEYLFQQRHAEFMAATEEEFAKLNGEFGRRCSKWFGRHVKAGSLRRLPPDLYVSILIGPCMEYTRHFLSGYTATPLEQAAGELALAAWRSLGVESDAESFLTGEEEKRDEDR